MDFSVFKKRTELNGDLPAAISRGRELFDDGFVLGPSRGNDVEVGERLAAVDRNIEDALPRTCPVGLDEVQAHCIRRADLQTWEDVAEVTIAFVLITRLWRRVADAACVDRIGHGRRIAGAAQVVIIRLEVPTANAPSSNGVTAVC